MKTPTSYMVKRDLPGITVIAALALALAGVVAGLAATPASAAVRDVFRAPLFGVGAVAPPNADTDGDKVFENLSARLGTLTADDRLSVIVRLRGDLTSERAAAVERAVGGFQLTRWLPIVDGFAATMTKAQVQALARLSSVAALEENGIVRAFNDSAQASFGVTRARADVPTLDGDTDGNVATYSANDLVVAVIDTGIDAAHPQLDDGKVIAFANCLNQPTPATCSRPAPFDDNDHGTHVAGTIVGDGEGDARYKGVAPGAALVGVKVLAANGSGSTAGVISGIQWVVQNKATYGIEAINLSLGGSGCSDGTDGSSAAAEAAVAAGIVVLVAGGNSGPAPCTIGSPGAAPNVITVGAMADTGVALPDVPGFILADFSSRGPTLDGRVKPDIAAPGVQVTSANANNANNSGAGPYVTFNGTSMATPFVAGVALLMLEANPAWRHADIKSILMSTAIDWGRGGSFHIPGSGGADVDYGAGRLDAFAAIKAAGAPLGAAPLAPAHMLFAGSLTDGGSQNHTVTVTSTTVPLAATLIMPSWSGPFEPDFDLALYDPDGVQIAVSPSLARQEQVGVVPTRTGLYTLTVTSYFFGTSDYILDVSGGSLVAPPPPEGIVVADFDGDGDTDISVWRPQGGTWYVFGGLTQQWGISTDVPVPGQYDGDPATDVAAWRPSNGFWYVQGGATQQWGIATDVPVPGDYDGDGDSEFAVWRPAGGTWYVQGGATQQWGISTDVPVPGDYDGDGDTDFAVWRPSTGTWYVQGGATQQWGVSTDVPVPGQYDGDPATDIAVWRPSTGTWYVHGGATQQWGVSTDVPVVGDYDGDGDSEFAVWRPSTGFWYVFGGATQQWGISGDKPLPLPPAIARLLFP